MEHKGQNTKRRFWNAIAAVAAIALLYAVFSLTGVGCPIKHVTGVSCPGCGMTSAVISARIVSQMRSRSHG